MIERDRASAIKSLVSAHVQIDLIRDNALISFEQNAALENAAHHIESALHEIMHPNWNTLPFKQTMSPAIV